MALSLREQFIMVGKVWQQELEAATNVTSTVRKQRSKDAGVELALFY